MDSEQLGVGSTAYYSTFKILPKQVYDISVVDTIDKYVQSLEVCAHLAFPRIAPCCRQGCLAPVYRITQQDACAQLVSA